MRDDARRLAVAALTGVALTSSSLGATPAIAWDRGAVETFAVLPAGTPMVEGLTVGPDGTVYVTTFNPTATSGPSQLFAFDDNGNLLRQVPIVGSSQATLGLAFHPTTHTLLVVDFGGGNVRAVDPGTGTSVVCITPTSPPGAPGLNALTFDAAGNTYISDSFNGIV